MYTKQSLMTDLQRSGINPDGTLFVHSSLRSVGKCEHGKKTVLDALIEYMKDGLLVMPTHTWDSITWDGFDKNGIPVGKNCIFDPASTLSCVGALTNLFLKQKGVFRSYHPTHSVAALGKTASSYIVGEELTRSPCSRKGCYGRLYDKKAQILFLGCDLSKNTFLHGVEEWNDIPDRLTERCQELFVKTEYSIISCPQRRHYFPNGDVSRNYIKMEKAFIEKGAASYCKIGNAGCVLCDAVKTADLTSHCLKKKPDLFSDEVEPDEALYADFM
jgi:aminoglycoside 3-N-acetyltransferase